MSSGNPACDPSHLFVLLNGFGGHGNNKAGPLLALPYCILLRKI
jgi:hypothetical protein